MDIKENFCLKNYNTFGIAAKAKHFVTINSIAQLQALLRLPNYPQKFVISGGSNMLLTQDIDALVMHINLKGIALIQETKELVHLKVMAGENWHQLVLHTLEQGYGGLENLSLIPGNIGTAPIQNIGAYGVELKDVFVSCEAMDIDTQELETFSKEDCQFGYRDSIFKNKAKGKYIITSVTLALTKENHTLKTFYGAIEARLKSMGITAPTIKNVSDAVIAIRQQKLPDPAEIGNSGSFFKNPIISKEAFAYFQKNNPTAPFYNLEDGSYKIPAGWLIEQSGFKGKRYGDAGVHTQQALVLVNYGKATGAEILALAQKIQATVKAKFGIALNAEVNIIK